MISAVLRCCFVNLLSLCSFALSYTFCAAFQAEEVDDDVLPDVDDDSFVALGLSRDQLLSAKAFRANGYKASSAPPSVSKATASVTVAAQPAPAPVVPSLCAVMNELLCRIGHPELTARWIQEEMEDSLLLDMELEVTCFVAQLLCPWSSAFPYPVSTAWHRPWAHPH